MDSVKDLKKDIKIMLYFLKLASNMSKTYIPILFLSSIFKALAPFINIIMPKFIIDELLGKQRIDRFILLVSIIVISNGIVNLVNRWLDTVVDIKNNEIVNGFDLLIGKKIMDMDFEKIEDPEVLNLKEKAIYPINNQGVIWRMIGSLVNALSQVITIIGLVAVISTLNIFIVLLIVAIVLLNSFIYKKSQETQYKFFGELTPINRKFQYYANVTTDFSMGKDIRLYNISPLIMDKIESYNKTSLEGFGKLFSAIGKYDGLNQVNVQIQMIAVYSYMTYKVFKNAIGIGDFTMYISAANSFSSSISGFLKTYIELRQMCRYLDLYLEFEQIKSIKAAGGKSASDIKDCTIEFKNVSFKYPRSESCTLKNISITINSGEKLSVVGLNGAGKTTFIKLLTRLYEPTEGEILLNGVNVKEYDYDEYMKLLSVVFQDFKLMAFSVKENIALEEHEIVGDEDVRDVLNKAGLEKDILKLDKGIHTSIYKSFDESGIEFSGGQAQKIAIARAIFKDAPIVVLDEPTAALDPLAEYEIYSRFNELIGDKTTIYISHRLSSCKFCDRIAVFHKGELSQFGTHEELINQKGSQYETMYMAQAQYYV
jgi:ATP-binding cassette subfamily B protein/ATP-binding cassette subfamily C protein